VTTSSEPSVRLSIPASARFLSAARVVAAALGADSGLSIDDLDDLRLGVNEMVSALVDGAAPDARVELQFVATDGAVTVTGVLDGGRAEGDAVADELTTRILDAVADHHALESSSFVLTKRSSLREPL
jgi:anti-sigma regulatory factor (Ser/Thr protein kinase)